MLGFAGGGACWASVEAAAAAQCGATGGTTSVGVVSCAAVAATSETGATLSLQWSTPDGTTSSSSVVTLPPCERFDIGSFWAPITGAFLLALVVVVCVKLTVRPMRREGH